MVIANKVDEIMRMKGITDAQLSDLTGLPRMTIGNARRGKNITLKTGLAISRALGESIAMIWSIREEGDEEERTEEVA